MQQRPSKQEYFEYYGTYVDKVPDGDILELATAQCDELRKVLGSLKESEAMVLHAPYTWTIKQVVGHLIDAERIFADRLHRFAAGDQQAQPGMDQDKYVAEQDFQTPKLQSLVDELTLCREANLLLIRRLMPGAWDYRGLASGYSFSVRALAWILVGHINHHLDILRRRIGMPDKRSDD